METAMAFVAPKCFCAVKYEVSPITCPKMKLTIKITHNTNGIAKISEKIPKINARITKVIVPNNVRKVLINLGEASCSVFLNNTFDITKERFAKIEISTPFMIKKNGSKVINILNC